MRDKEREIRHEWEIERKSSRGERHQTIVEKERRIVSGREFWRGEMIERENKPQEFRRQLEIMTEIEQKEVKHTRRQKEMPKNAEFQKMRVRMATIERSYGWGRDGFREKEKWREG